MTNAARRPGRILVLLAIALTLPLAAPRVAHGQTYWFEDYAKAVSLVDHQQMDEASAILDRLIEQHPVPLAGFRIYGDTYLDYFPYYQRARVQLYRGDLRGASHSLDICEAFGAMRQSRSSENRLRQMRLQISEMEKRTAKAAPETPASSD